MNREQIAEKIAVAFYNKEVGESGCAINWEAYKELYMNLAYPIADQILALSPSEELISDEEINQVKQDYLDGKPFNFPQVYSIKNTLEACVAQLQSAHTAQIKDREIEEILKTVFATLEEYQVKTRNGSKIIYGSNFNYVKAKYLK